MPKIIIEALNTPNIWQLSKAPELRISASRGFFTDLGQWIGPGPHLYLAVPTELDNVNNILTIPPIEIDSTPDDGSVSYNAILVQPGGVRMVFLDSFRVPGTQENTTWSTLKAFKNAQQRVQVSTTYITAADVFQMINDALGSRDYASPTRQGSVAISHDATDPLYPTAVSVTHPVWESILAGEGLAAAAGRTAMVNGLVTVNTALVIPTSVPVPVGLDAGVTGKLHIENIVDGVSFDIASDNIGDNGQIGWVLFNI